MKSAQTFNKIVLDDTYSPNDYPNAYQVFVSNDGSSWGNAIASGSGTVNQTAITFTLVTARYIKIVQTGTVGSWWSIHDFEVFKQ
jgi:hypothetical protein